MQVCVCIYIYTYTYIYIYIHVCLYICSDSVLDCVTVSFFLVSSRKISMANCREVEQLGHSNCLSRHASLTRMKCKKSQSEIQSGDIMTSMLFFRARSQPGPALGEFSQDQLISLIRSA